MTTTNERTAEDWGRVAMSLPGFPWRRPRRHTDQPFRSSAGVRWFRVTEDGSPPKFVPSGPRQSFGSGRAWYHAGSFTGEWVPDPDDASTTGRLLALLGEGWCITIEGGLCGLWRREDSRDLEGLSTLDEYEADPRMHIAPSLGRACIAAAEALGRWPGAGK